MNLLLLLLLSTFNLQEDLSLLNDELLRSELYQQQHLQHIDSLRMQRQQGDDSFGTCLRLFDCYASFHFDSAYSYVCELEQIAQAGGDKEEMVKAAIKKAFAYFSAGLFKEAGETLAGITDLESCSREVQAYYYLSYARLCFDLGTYAEGVFYVPYTQQAISLLDREIALLTPADTGDYYYALALRAMKMGDQVHALDYFRQCLQDQSLTTHDKAIIYSSMSYPADQQGDKDLALHYMIQAAIADIQACVKEGVALRMVASMLHERGMINEAVEYIEYAQRNAVEYGARHRQMEVSQILPIIEQEHVVRIRERNRRIYALSVSSLILLIICVIVLVLIHKRNTALSAARQVIGEMNDKLVVANKLKEEYIGSFLCWQCDFINEVERYQRHIQHAVSMRRYESLANIPRQADATHCREEFYYRFDEMFLRIFPTFVQDFNALLRAEEQIKLQKGELLNTNLRIFALIRLGITQNEVIAAVLNYSVNTIYTYKTKMKGKSDLSADEFYARVMQIPSHG